MHQLFAAVVILVMTLVPAFAQVNNVAERDAIAAVLDDFHKAASQADGERYFAHFAEDAVFLGTDAKERWTVQQFRKFATPYFDKGQGWTYLPVRRYITIHQHGEVAWFDELLDSVKFGQVRGSGVLIKTQDVWKVSLYDLHFPIPNDLAAEFTSRIKSHLEQAEPPAPAKKVKQKAQKEAKIAEQEAKKAQPSPEQSEASTEDPQATGSGE